MAFRVVGAGAVPDSLVVSDFPCESLIALGVVERAICLVALDTMILSVERDIGRGSSCFQSVGFSIPGLSRRSRRRRPWSRFRDRAVQGGVESLSHSTHPCFWADAVAGPWFQHGGRSGCRGVGSSDGRGVRGPRRPCLGGRGARCREDSVGDTLCGVAGRGRLAHFAGNWGSTEWGSSFVSGELG